MGNYAKRMFDAVHAYRHNMGTLAAVLGISLLVDSMNIGVMLLLAQAMNPSGAAWEMGMLVPLVLLPIPCR